MIAYEFSVLPFNGWQLYVANYRNNKINYNKLHHFCVLISPINYRVSFSSPIDNFYLSSGPEQMQALLSTLTSLRLSIMHLGSLKMRSIFIILSALVRLSRVFLALELPQWKHLNHLFSRDKYNHIEIKKITFDLKVLEGLVSKSNRSFIAAGDRFVTNLRFKPRHFIVNSYIICSRLIIIIILVMKTASRLPIHFSIAQVRNAESFHLNYKVQKWIFVEYQSIDRTYHIALDQSRGIQATFYWKRHPTVYRTISFNSTSAFSCSKY